MTRDTTPTDRRAYEKPEIGDDWAQAWDDLVEDLDAEALFDEPGEINTNNLSDDAVTAAKIAAAAVESGAIAEDAVGVDELANALGTSETEQIPGTTHFENTEHESVNTEAAKNSAIDDGLNYLSPQWLAQSTAYYFSTMFESLDGFSQAISGSGSVSIDEKHVSLSTGETDGSDAEIRKRPRGSDVAREHVSWNKDYSQYWLVDFQTGGPDAYVSRGLVRQGAYTFNHIGVGMSGGDLIGTVSDGSNQTTVTLISGASTGSRQVWVDVTAGERAEFYIDDRSSLDGEITTNLPMEDGRSETWVHAYVSNEDAGSDDEVLNFIRTVGVQSP